MGDKISRSVPLLMAAIMLMMPLAAVFPGAMADETVPPKTPSVDPVDVQDAVLKGLDWFSRNQAMDGGWRNSVGITGFIVICFTNAGYDHTNRTVQRALGFMRNFYNPMEGSMADSFLNYDNAISVVAMSAAGDPEDKDKLENMTRFLMYLQFEDEKQMYNVSEDWYIGGWPNYAGIPDISNSQFGLLGLQAADLYTDATIPETVWSNATTFLRYCQNLPDVNVMEWAHNTSLPSYDDGGFVYNAHRSRTESGEEAFESYGSITAAGLYSYLLCGNDPRQSEVAAAIEWINDEYTINDNPRMGGEGHYYYLWTLARALSMSPNEWIVDGSGKLRDWRPEMASFFMNRQRPDGSWPGNPQIGWREEEPELEGIYALLTLQAAYMTTPDPTLTIEVEGGDAVTFIDINGRGLTSDVSHGLTVSDRTLTCTAPETFRKVWVKVDGGLGNSAIITATGTWGDGRTSSQRRSLDLGPGGASAMVASGSFAGPFAINIMGFDRGPVVETKDMVRLDLVRGETEIVPVDLVETSGEGPVVDVMLISYSGDAAVADVDEQGVRVPAGGEGSLGLTITVDGSVKLGRTWTMVVVSSTAPPVAIEVEVVDADETWTPSTMYWVVLGVLMLAMVIFFILPNMGKPTVIDDYALDEE